MTDRLICRLHEHELIVPLPAAAEIVVSRIGEPVGGETRCARLAAAKNDTRSSVSPIQHAGVVRLRGDFGNELRNKRRRVLCELTAPVLWPQDRPAPVRHQVADEKACARAGILFEHLDPVGREPIGFGLAQCLVEWPRAPVQVCMQVIWRQFVIRTVRQHADDGRLFIASTTLPNQPVSYAELAEEQPVAHEIGCHHVTPVRLEGAQLAR